MAFMDWLATFVGADGTGREYTEPLDAFSYMQEMDWGGNGSSYSGNDYSAPPMDFGGGGGGNGFGGFD